MKLAIEVLVFLVVFLAVQSYVQRDLLKTTIPDFNATLLNGEIIHIKEKNTKPLLLYFWASWCPVCKMTRDSIESLSKDYQVITVAMNSGNDMEVEQYMKDNQLTFPVIVDENGELAKKFGVRGVPAGFFVKPGGKIAFTEMGYTSEIGYRTRMWIIN